jgi:hypothetical protein
MGVEHERIGHRRVSVGVSTVSAVTTDEFWNLVDRARGQATDGDADMIGENLVGVLSTLPDADILGAGRILDGLMSQAMLVDLWAAAYAIGGGCSDDGFEDFRGWLVSRGREVFERVVADPDALADLPEVHVAINRGDHLSGESTVFAAWRAWEQRTGEECPPEPDADVVADQGKALVFDYDFDDRTAVSARLPRLAARVSGLRMSGS